MYKVDYSERTTPKKITTTTKSIGPHRSGEEFQERFDKDQDLGRKHFTVPELTYLFQTRFVLLFTR